MEADRSRTFLLGGVRFLAVGLEHARLIRSPGLWSLCAARSSKVILVGSGREVGPEAMRTHQWAAALRLGADEFLFTLGVRDPLELAHLRSRLVRLVQPLLQGEAETARAA